MKTPPALAAWSLNFGLQQRSEKAEDTTDFSRVEFQFQPPVYSERRDLLKTESAELLLDTMQRCRTGEARFKEMLPLGTEETGTIGGTTNDVGIVTLPDDAGQVAIAVFVKSSEKETSARERVIAEVARAVHDYFLFQPASASQ